MKSHSLDYSKDVPRRFIVRPRIRRKTAIVVSFTILTLCVLIGLAVLDRLQGNRTISFYGQIIDESGRGIPNVTVNAEIGSASPLDYFRNPWKTENKHSLISTLTDSEGKFAIHSWSGLFLSITALESPDLLWKWKNDDGHGFQRSFSYSDRYPLNHPPVDPAHPIQYIMIPATEENKKEMMEVGASTKGIRRDAGKSGVQH